MRNSTNYSLLLPEENDSYSVNDMNANTEFIDAQMKKVENEAAKGTKAVNDLQSHVANESNPHGVTKEQVGLGNVPNVSTNNQAPTYAVPSSLSAMSSGEVLSTAFGKIAKAVSTLISHIADSVSHITSAERSLWNGKADASLLNSRIPQYFNVNTQAELDAVVNDYSANLVNNTYYNFTLSVAVGTLSITGGTYFVEGLKTSADYEWQRMTKYPSGSTVRPWMMSGRSKYAGVWTAWENVAMQGELTSVKGNAESSYRIGQVNITPANIGLGNVNNTADSAKNVLSASKLTTPRTISLAGDVTGSVSFDGSANVSMTTAIADDSHNHTIANIDGLQAALDSKADSFFSVSIYDMAQGRLQFGWSDTAKALLVLIDGYQVGALYFGEEVG